ncbi:hypothetical protein PENSPDRAFT_666259 [Peniophora sp. CONT]|nr:hypothetical protein PENSPDRAFT_666259 [Peniophora sp. CONT]
MSDVTMGSASGGSEPPAADETAAPPFEGGGAGGIHSATLESIRQQLESMASELARQGADIAAQNNDITAQTASFTKHTAILQDVLRRLEDFNLNLRLESRSLEVGVRIGFERVDASLLVQRQQFVAHTNAVIENFNAVMAIIFERLGGTAGGPSNFFPRGPHGGPPGGGPPGGGPAGGPAFGGAFGGGFGGGSFGTAQTV